MKNKDYSLEVFVNGKPVHEYEHNGNTFIEGRKSSPFEIEFRNHTAGRVLVVPSVDGVSTLDGQKATAESPGYVVKGYDTLRIKGWTVDGGNVAQFVFQDKENSYGTHVTRTRVQAGVVGVIVYKEKKEPVPAPLVQPFPVYIPTPVSPPFAPYQPWALPQVLPYNGPIWTTDNRNYHNTMGIGVCNAVASGKSLLDNVMVGASLSAADDSSDSTSYGADASRRVQMTMNTTATASLNATASSSPFELGTGWGDKVEMKTNSVIFNRGELDVTIALYYDSRRNLEKRGIEVLKREPRVSNELPQAFAGVACKPPPGWHG